MRRLNILVVALVLLLGLPFYWLLLDNQPGDARPKALHIAQLRQLADSIPGDKPIRLDGELSASRSVARDLFAAGAGLKREPIAILAWRLWVPGGKSVMIDSGIAQTDALAMGLDRTFPASQARIERALHEAALVLFTHEHPDHEAAALRMTGGIPKGAQFNTAQLPPSPLAQTLPWPHVALPAPTLIGSAPQAVAPGVVVIPAVNSHTPGSQMIYARLADGRELLFTGDIATLRFSWQDLRARSRLVSQFLAPENRSEVYSWLRTIRQLKAESPALEIIAGHDSSPLLSQQGKKPVATTPFGFDLQH